MQSIFSKFGNFYYISADS